MKLTTKLLLALTMLTFVGQAMALKSDRDQPADIEADDIEFDFKKGTRTYINNVLAIQGTLRLKADKLIAEYDGSELKSATMWGSLARFKQRPDGKEHDVEGWAKKIVVDQQANTLTLIGKAALKQGPQTARGETIVYNMANDTLKVQGGARMKSVGADGEDKKRSIKDPFANNPDGPAPPKQRKVAKKKTKPAAKETSEFEQPEDTTEGDEQVVETEDAPEEVEEQTRSGRSRLIINPK